MKKNKKNLMIVLSLLLVLVFSLSIIKPVRADSGFDSSYDSYDSGWSSSDWGWSSSDWGWSSNDWGWSSSHSGSSEGKTYEKGFYVHNIIIILVISFFEFCYLDIPYIYSKDKKNAKIIMSIMIFKTIAEILISYFTGLIVIADFIILPPIVVIAYSIKHTKKSNNTQNDVNELINKMKNPKVDSSVDSVVEKKITDVINSNSIEKSEIIRNNISDLEIKKYLPDYEKEKFDNEVFDLFVKIQNAWTNFDYETLRNCLTDELYNQYKMQLESLKAVNETNMMNDFRNLGVSIIDIREENNITIIDVIMKASFYDYIARNNITVRGSSRRKIYIKYKITFLMDKEASKICPKCNATLTDSSSQVCQYCNSTVNRIGRRMVMSKKENKEQW